MSEQFHVPQQKHPTVFISYSHDSLVHSEHVLLFSAALRGHGIDVELDQFHQDEIIDWPRWCNTRTSHLHSDFVLCVCTAEYFRRIEGNVPPEKGRGVYWEGSLIDDELYDTKGNRRILPVLFAAETESSIPRFLRGWTFSRVKSFDLKDAGYQNLIRILTGQASVTKNSLGPVPILPQQRLKTVGSISEEPATDGASGAVGEATAHVATFPGLATSRLPIAPNSVFVGRLTEFGLLDSAWKSSGSEKVNLVCLVAKGGEGKTTLLVRWLHNNRYGRAVGAERFLDWSFYTQGTTTDRAVTTDPFFDTALRFFGETAPEKYLGWEKGDRLAALVSGQRALIILDGIESFQNPPGPNGGYLRDLALKALLLGLSRQNQGLCVVTTRFPVGEFLGQPEPSVRNRELNRLSPEECVKLLQELRVGGSALEMKLAGEALKGHALALTLLGNYLSNATEDRDIIRWREVALLAEDAEEGGHTERLLRAYEEWIGKDSCSVGILRLLGLFGRPAETKSLDELRRKPVIPGLTDAIVSLPRDKWFRTLRNLENLHLIVRNGDCVEAHALIREYFALRVRTESPEAWKEAQNRLYRHLREQAPPHPVTMEQMRPLYYALAHGCAAGQYQSCLADFYRRVCNEKEDYAAKKLGAHSADLVALSGFFEQLWTKPTEQLPDAQRAFLLSSVSFRLAAQGRLAEARDTAEAGLAIDIPLGNFTEASRSASSLSRLHLLLADLPAARLFAQQGMELADRSDDVDNVARRRASLAHVLHLSGELEKSRELFLEAEQILSDKKKRPMRLKSLAGAYHCALLLTLGCVEEAENRAQELVRLGRRDGAPLAIALGLLYQCHSMLKQDGRASVSLDRIEQLLSHAESFLRFAAQQEFFPALLFVRATLHVKRNDIRRAEADLTEAEECTRRAGIKIYLADVFIHRASLLKDREALVQGKNLIEEWGYWRWKNDLAKAEELLA